MHWFWRATIAVGVGILCYGLTHDGYLFGPLYAVTTNARMFVMELLGLRADTSTLYFPVNYVVCAVVEGGIPAVSTLFSFGVLSRFWSKRDQLHVDTRCRRCGYILRGISEPRCSECGERI